MKQFGKIMLMVFGVGILAAGLSSIPSRPAVASVAAQVQVVNTPLPVQGTVDVSNFPPTQNVAITGTPTVNANVTFPSSVDVANPATAPLFVVNLDEPGRTPYQPVSACVAANISCESVFPGVPSNHRLVLQHISGTTIWSSAPSAVFGFARNGAGVVVTRFLAQTSDTTTFFDQPVLVYYDAGQQPDVVIIAGALTSTALGGNITLSGYLVDCGVAPCAAIAQ
jgi:hypothetical protein